MTSCGCGCGRSTNLAPKTSARRGWIKGEALRFVLGHGNSLPASEKITSRDGLCGCGCGGYTVVAVETNRGRGNFKGQPIRFLLGHRPRLKNPGHAVDSVTGCWNWLGYVNPRTGYSGMMQVDGRPEIAHRAYYKKLRGPIPADMELDHTCRNRKCVNPDHLEPVSAAENARRRPDTKLTDELAAHARRLVGDGATRKAVAGHLRVSRSLISMVVSGKRWA